MFELFIDNEFISSNQSGFKLGDSCTNQFLCIIHNIYQSFDDGLKMRADFPDVSKLLDKVWQEDLLYVNWRLNSKPKKTKRYFERTVFKSMLTLFNIGPLFLLIYINNLSDDLTSNLKIIFGW